MIKKSKYITCIIHYQIQDTNIAELRVCEHFLSFQSVIYTTSQGLFRLKITLTKYVYQGLSDISEDGFKCSD
jgi:hypothetical protein